MHTHEDLIPCKNLSVILDTPVITVLSGHKDTGALKLAAHKATSRFCKRDLVTENSDSDGIVFLTSSGPCAHTSVPQKPKRRLF